MKTVVDVGGGLGSTSTVLTKAYPNLKIILQDRPTIIDDAKKVLSICTSVDGD